MLKWIVAALIALPLLGGVAVASAAPVRDAVTGDRPVRQESDRPETDRLQHDRPHVAGLVVDEHGQTFEVRTRTGAVSVHWTDATGCQLDGAPVDCDAINPGHALLAIGAFAGGSEQFHADLIRARSIDRPTVDRIAGIIVRDGDGTLAVRTRDGELTLLYGPDTVCQAPDGEIRCDDLVVGDAIGAAGQLSGTEFTARLIVRRAHRDHRDHARVVGVVLAAHERLLQVETRDGMWNVRFDEATTCQLRDGTAIDCGSIAERARVAAAGVVNGDHTLDAKRIVVLPDRPTVDHVRPDVATADLAASGVQQIAPR